MKIDNEEWRPISGYEGYEVSNFGMVRSCWIQFHTEKGSGWSSSLSNVWTILKSGKCNGYVRVSLCKDGRMRHKFVHRLVLEAFVGPCQPGLECRHMDGDRTNNKLTNLKWGTRLENNQDRRRHGTTPQGERNPFAKLTEDKVIKILKAHAKGDSQSKISRDFGIGKSTAGHIVHRRHWKHVEVTDGTD